MLNARRWYRSGFKSGDVIAGRQYSELECFQKSLEVDPNIGIRFYLGSKGGGEVAGRQYSEAECYQHSLEIDPYPTAARINLGVKGVGEVAGRQYSEAECFQHPLEIDRNNAGLGPILVSWKG